MARLEDVIGSGTHAARPSAGSAGVLYYETDTDTLFRDSGTDWARIAGTGSAVARATNSADQSIANATSVAIPFNTTNFDQGTSTAQHSTSSNTSRLTCQVAGIYQIVGYLCYSGGTGGGWRQANLRLNGSTVFALTHLAPASGGEFINVVAIYKLAVNDYVELVGYQDSGGSLTISAVNGAPSLSWARVG